MAKELNEIPDDPYDRYYEIIHILRRRVEDPETAGKTTGGSAMKSIFTTLILFTLCISVSGQEKPDQDEHVALTLKGSCAETLYSNPTGPNACTPDLVQALAVVLGRPASLTEKKVEPSLTVGPDEVRVKDDPVALIVKRSCAQTLYSNPTGPNACTPDLFQALTVALGLPGSLIEKAEPVGPDEVRVIIGLDLARQIAVSGRVKPLKEVLASAESKETLDIVLPRSMFLDWQNGAWSPDVITGIYRAITNCRWRQEGEEQPCVKPRFNY